MSHVRADEHLAPVGEPLSRHVPAVAAEWMSREPERRWQVLDGSLCFADISGFTSLTERLAARGRVGAEELVDTLSGVFGTMLEVAAEQGGELLKFGGDALLLLFDGDDHASRAAESAVAMRRALRDTARTTSVGRLHLSMSVGIGSGDIHLFLVGAPNRELVVVGPAVAGTIAAESAASAGRILVTNETAQLLPRGAVRDADGTHHMLRWRRPPVASHRPVVTREGPAVDVASLLPPELVRVLASNPEPGHRVATIGFIGMSGIDELFRRGPEIAADGLDETMRTIQEAFRGESVTFLAVDVQPGGGKVFSASGVPANSEDDEGSMLRAMRQIATTPLPLDLSFGVSRGHVFVAELGSHSRAAYSAMGDTTNTAARIMSKAPTGSVYAHPLVLDHSRTLFETRAVGPFAMKGKAEPMMLYDVGSEVGVRTDDRSDALPLAGRDSELTALNDSLDRLAGGRGGVLTLTGPTGMGKSRLVREALARYPALDRLLLRAEPYGSASPYRPLRDPMRALLGVERGERDVMAAALVRTTRRLDESLTPFAPLLGHVAQVDVPPTAESDVIAVRHRPDRTADVVIRLLELTHAGPLVVVVEDAQWADESTALLLARLEIETAERPWLLVTVRRDGTDGFVPVDGTSVALGPLDDKTMRALVIDATEAAPLRTHEIDLIVARAAGNPLFVEEWTRAARTLGSIDAVPDSLHAAIASQVDSLTPFARRTLAYASVLGRSFRRRMLVALLAEEHLVLDTVTEIELEQFLTDDGTERLRFNNGLVRDVAYEGLAFRTRARLHRTAGETLERIAGDLGDNVDTIAEHYWRAGDHLRTWNFSLSAADRARRAYANAEAAMQIERALEAARWLDEVTDGERLVRWLQLGELRDRAGQLDESLDAYRRAARYLGDDPLARADLLLRRAYTHERAGAYTVALGETSRARAVLNGAHGRQAAVARADALAFAALVRQRQEHAAEAMQLAELAESEGARAHATSAQARACNVISWACTMLGRPDAVAWARRALELYEIVGDLDGQADMANNIGVQAYFEGRWDETLAQYQRSRDACELVGNVTEAAASDANIGEVLVNQGRLAEAEPLLREANRVMRASGYPRGAAFAEMHLGRLLSQRGELVDAEALLTDVRDRLLALGRAASAYETSLHLADCLNRMHRSREAVEELERAVRSTADDVSIFDSARARIRASSLLGLGRIDEAVAELEAGIACARARGLEYELGLMLSISAVAPVAIATGADEPPGHEAARLLERLGVVGDVGSEDVWRHFHNGSP